MKYTTALKALLVLASSCLQCAYACTAYDLTGPSYSPPDGEPQMHGLVSVFAHELAETASDPLFTGWYNDANGQENADLCAWNFQ